MRTIICGGREFENQDAMFVALDLMHAEIPISVVIQGGARGADLLGGAWGAKNLLPVLQVNAHWEELGRSAGPIRNEWMLDHCAPEQVIAFPGGSGTSNMVNQTRSRELPVIFPLGDDWLVEYETTKRRN